MTFLDFFAGIGGFRLGMEMAWHECVGHCEINKFADRSYRAMHDVKESEWYANDITRVKPSELPDDDCYCFGFPCQAFSIAGKRRGFEDTRGTLFFEVMRLAKVRRPHLLFAENVAGLLSHEGGQTFGVIISTMDELGYDVEWQVLNSKHFGVPQNRERVFVIGHLRGCGGRKVFPIRDECEKVDAEQGEYAKTITTRNYRAISEGTYIAEQSGVKQIGNVMPTKTRDNPNQGRVYSPEGLAPRLSRMDGGGREPMVVSGIYTNVSGDFIRPPLPGISRCLKANKADAGVVVPVIAPNRKNKQQNGRRFKEDGDPMFTLTAQDRHGVLQGQAVRKLTPRECFRLQGFSDEYFDRAAAVNSDSQLYKQAGNSVTVNVIYEIARRLS